MKPLLTLSYLFITFSLCAQYTPAEIKKYKISKITVSSVTNGSEEAYKTETRYDDKGNDTAIYTNGEIYKRKKYEYNTKGQATTSTSYGKDGKEIETAVYTYKTDGSYTISNTDKSFGMTDMTYCDKSGKITKTKSPDGTERIYTYNASGRVTKIKSTTTDNGGVVTDIQYSYNAKGQLYKEISKGDYKWNKTFTWNAKGLIAKAKNTSETDGVANPEVTYTYEYEFRK